MDEERRYALRELNARSWNGDYEFPTNAKLDSSLKKNTAFLKKIKTSLTADKAPQILADIKLLTLEKYLSEVIVSIAECLPKVSKNEDVAAVMEIISAFHQRFNVLFTPQLMVSFIVNMQNPTRKPEDPGDEKEEGARIIRQKNLLKLMTEFCIIDVFGSLAQVPRELIPDNLVKRYATLKDPIYIVMLKDILNFEVKTGNSLPIFTSFLRRFYPFIADDECSVFDPEETKTLKLIIKVYSSTMFKFYANYYDQLTKAEARTKKAALRTGKILEEYTEEQDKANDLFQKFKVNCEIISTITGLPLPELEESTDDTQLTTIEIMKQKSLNEDDFGGVWENLKEKQFYTKITPLAEILEQHRSEIAPTTEKSGEKVTELLNRLCKCTSDLELEKIVVEFHHTNLNNKATKNRMMKFFMEGANANDFRFVAKFLKYNETELQDLISDLIEYLDKGFRSQIYSNRLNFRNIYFFVELVKFKMIPIHVIFHKIRKLTQNIGETNNIDILSVLYDHVGRFLKNEPEYKDLMQEMITLLKKKLKEGNFNINDKLAIRNLLLTVEPAQTQVKKLHQMEPKLSPEEKFIIRSVRVDLNPSTINKVWGVIKTSFEIPIPEIRNTLVNIFTKPELMNYENIADLAVLLRKIARGAKDRYFIMVVTDSIIEQVLRGLEQNDYRQNRTRTAQIKYIAHLFDNGLIKFKLVNKLLMTIMTFGHPNNQVVPGNYDVSIDMPNNYFRIQLCCFLLLSIKLERDTKDDQPIGIISEDSLMAFMIFFQYYMFCKVQPLPMELEFRVKDLFDKYSYIEGVQRYEDLRQVIMALQELMKTKGMGALVNDDNDDDDNAEYISEEEEEVEEIEEDDVEEEEMDKLVEVDGDDGSSEEFSEDVDSSDTDSESDESDSDRYDDSEDDEEDEDEDDSENSSLSGSEEEDSEEEDSEQEDEEEEEAAIVTGPQISEEDKKFFDGLDKEFQKILIESYATGRTNNKKLNIPMPSKASVQAQQEMEIPEDEGKMRFKLMTRNGKKTDFKQLLLPSDSLIAENRIKQQNDIDEHKQRMMNLVMNMD